MAKQRTNTTVLLPGMPGTQLTPYIHSNEGIKTINSLTSEKAHQKCNQHHGWMRTYP